MRIQCKWVFVSAILATTLLLLTPPIQARANVNNGATSQLQRTEQPRPEQVAAGTLTPINAAEAIIEVFWDPAISGLGDWNVAEGGSYGLTMDQFWCRARGRWSHKPPQGPAVHMSKPFQIDCSGYDKMIVSASFPDTGTLKVIAETDRGIIEQEFDHLPDFVSEITQTKWSDRTEYSLDLQGAQRLEAVTLEFYTVDEGFGGIYLYWIGLQNSQILPRVLGQYDQYEERWPGLLKPQDYQPQFEPTYEFLIDKEDLQRLRLVHQIIIENDGQSNFTKEAEFARKRSPESMINRFANFNGEMFARDRDKSRWLVSTGVNAALAGLIMEDADLLRLAARYALSIAVCEYWDAGFICYHPTSAFEQRSFTQSVNAHDVALLCDLAGEMLTEAGKQLIRRKLAEHALGQMNYVYWKWEYIYDCNQAAWFSPGRILSYLVLEQSWPRVKPYTELAYQDLIENLNRSILPDGGYPEGPTYFRSVGRDGGLSLYYYAHGRAQELKDIIPERMKRTDDFAEAVSTTVPEDDILRICDAAGYCDPLTKAVMATIFPEGAWGRMLMKTLERSSTDASVWPLQEKYVNTHMGSLSDLVLAWKLAQDLHATAPASQAKPFVFLPDTGYMASTRILDSQIVKLFIMGNSAGSGHTHEDKGSFILEVAGETFALDPGIGSYNDPVGELSKYCQSHNMLVPIVPGKRPAPKNPIPVDVKPSGFGDNTSFRARIDATPGWETHFRRWTREWTSPRPDTVIIKDDYELVAGDGVVFYWQTQRDVQVAGHVLTIAGKQAKIELEIPHDCTVDVESIDKGLARNRIAIRKQTTEGTLEIKARITIF